MDTFTLNLRDTNVPKGKNVNMLVSKKWQKKEGDEEAEDGVSARRFASEFESFVAEVRALHKAKPLNPKHNDIFFSAWAQQLDCIIPLSFYELIAETKLRVVFDINS